VTVGLAIVVAVAVAAGPSPASLRAVTETRAGWPSGSPVIFCDVPVVRRVWPLTVTTYSRIGRPLSAGGCQLTVTVPGSLGATAAMSSGWPGTVNGTTVSL